MSQGSIKAFFIILLFSCASQFPPSGGEEDINGPEYISSSFAESKNGLYIEIIFNEKINPQSIVGSLSIQPDIDITTKVKNNMVHIYSDDGFSPSLIHRVVISRSIRDSHGNPMDAPVSFALSRGGIVPESSIAGLLYNTSADIYSISLNDCEEPDSVIYLTESSSDNSFVFPNIEPGSYFVLAVSDAGASFSDTISSSEFAFSSRCLDLASNEQLDGIGLLISKPLSIEHEGQAGSAVSDTTIAVDSNEIDTMNYGSLSGVVVGDSGASYVVRAQSDILPTSKMVRTDTDGRYILENMPEGFYSIYAYEDNSPIISPEYFSGSMTPFSLAAPFIFMGDSVEVRGGWEIGLEDVKFKAR